MSYEPCKEAPVKTETQGAEGTVSPAQAARILGISVDTVRRYLRLGTLGCVVTPIGRLVPVEEVARFREMREGRAGEAG